MPPKKKSTGERQNNLKEFLGDGSNKPTANAKESLQRQIDKLLKLRKDIQKKQMEQHRLMRKVLQLQIESSKTQVNQNENNSKDGKQYSRKSAKEYPQKFSIRSEQELLKTTQGSGMFRLILGECIDYEGQEPSQQYKNQQKSETETESVKDDEDTKTELIILTKQWNEHRNMKQQYLTEYRQDFLSFLDSCQYVADDRKKKQCLQLQHHKRVDSE